MRHLRTFRFIEEVARVGSIRKAAEDMNITASALNRQIQAFEEEFGTQVFERLPRGVRLNAAGELLMEHFRQQQYDFARLQSQIADLSGVRRGHVKIACSQGPMPYFLPQQIALYRHEHPGVTFSISVRDRAEAEKDLADLNSDLALVFEPAHLVDFQIIHVVPQPIVAVFASDHPLAAKDEVRLRDCMDYGCVVPHSKYGTRTLLDTAIRRLSRTPRLVLEADSFDFMRHYILYENAVGFQIPIGLSPGDMPGLTFRPIARADLPAGRLFLGQMRGRPLSVASARFASQLIQALDDCTRDYDDGPG